MSTMTNNNRFQRAVKMLETYFGGEEEEESSNISPEVSKSNNSSIIKRIHFEPMTLVRV